MTEPMTVSAVVSVASVTGGSAACTAAQTNMWRGGCEVRHRTAVDTAVHFSLLSFSPHPPVQQPRMMSWQKTTRNGETLFVHTYTHSTIFNSLFTALQKVRLCWPFHVSYEGTETRPGISRAFVTSQRASFRKLVS